MENIYLYQDGHLRVDCGTTIWLLIHGLWYRFTDDLSHELDLFLESGEIKSRLAALIRFQPELANGLPELAGRPCRRIVYDSLLRDAPSLLFLELTSKCPLHCRHCYMSGAPEQSDFMTAELAEQILAEAGQLNFRSVQLTGGDPALHPDLPFLANRALELGISRVEVFATAMTMSHPLVKAMNNRVCYALTCYSYQTDVHDEITGVSGSWERLMAAIDLLLEHERDFRVGIILMAENAGHYEETRQFLLERGVPEDQIGGSFSSEVGRGKAYYDDTRIRPRKPDEEGPPERPAGKFYRWRGKAAVDPQGNVYPCVFARWLKLGNVRADGGLGRILANRHLETDVHIPDVAERWEYCAKRLSCADCRLLAFSLMSP